MVTKLAKGAQMGLNCYILAKNHMVTKRQSCHEEEHPGYILAKNHMVTKRALKASGRRKCYILAKNHMVTKPQIS